MKNFILRLLKPFIKRKIKKLLNDKKQKANIIKMLNKKLDIPKVDEKAEAKLLDGIYEAIKGISLELVDNI